MAVVQVVPSALRVAVRHPVVSGGFLLLLSLPAFHVLVYFFPLLLSTALCVAALFLGHKAEQAAAGGSKMKLLSAWLMKIRSSHVENQADLAASEEDECCDDDDDKGKFSPEYEHELRVRQLERTLRTLSFVSYEGIFDAEGSILDEHHDDEAAEANAAAASSSGCNPDMDQDQPEEESVGEQPRAEKSMDEPSCSTRPEEDDPR